MKEMKTFLHQFRQTNHIQDATKINILHWQIPDFQWLLDNQTNREIRIETANTTENSSGYEDCKYKLKIKFVGNQNDLIEIYYIAPVHFFLKCILSVWSTASGAYTVECAKDYYWVKTKKWELLTVLFKPILLREKLHSNSSFCLKFEFCVRNRASILAKEMPGPQLIDKDNFYKPKSHLINDLENLYGNPSFSDVILKSVEGVEFPAHKVVLVTRSVVLRAHFEHKTVESLTNIVESVLEADVMQQMLSYIYTENVPKIDEMPEKLLMAADYYQLNGLKLLCEKALRKKLTVENAIEILELANLHSATTLKQQILEFIHDGQARDILKTKGWEKLQSITLMKDLYEYNIINH